jgi:hypothetical protein
MIETDDVAGWIHEARFAPQPRFIAWLLGESQPFGLEFGDGSVECRALEVHDGL